jgi:hypothetical protein
MPHSNNTPLVWESFVTLSKSELRNLERLVHSPFFNRKAQLIRLFEYLRTCREHKTVPTPVEACRAAHPESEFDVTKLRLAYSDLLELIEQFWTVQAALDDKVRHKIRLSAEYRKRGLQKHLSIAQKEAKMVLEQHPHRDVAYFEAYHDLELEIYQAAATNKRYESFNLQAISDGADTAYIARKLQHICTALSHQAVFKTEYNFGLFEAVLAEVREKKLLQYPAIALYYYAIQFMTGSDTENYFRQFSQILHEHAHRFPQDELRALYLLAINFGVKKCNTGIPEWYRFTFDLYREALEQDLLLDCGSLSRFAYNNLAIIGGRAGEIAWVEDFLQRYKPFVDRAWREASFSLNMARLSYQKKQYKEALQYLQHADYKDFINSMNAKILQLKIYFDTREYNVLESHLDSMQGYIRRHRAGGYHRDNYLNIVQYTRVLMRSNTPTELADLRQKIEQTAILTEREWLLEKIS